ncbi:MAG: hypothetical protein Q7T18_12110 [Sedimentisphaerales bacterium]|nr:hypothetical protein [Sedimentisphaerales bacterium]
MNAENEYLQSEAKSVLTTVSLIDELIAKNSLNQFEIIALGKLLQDIYTGIERILRCRLEMAGIKTAKTESWHKELLLKAKTNSLISDQQFDAISKLLVFRHMQIHGYGSMLNEDRLRELAQPAVKFCREFLK